MFTERTEALRPSDHQRVAVIGAGVSGLTAAKYLLDEAIEPIVFEQAKEIGGLWNYDEEQPDGGGIAYRSLRTNTSKQTMAFSDFPFPVTLPDFPHRSDVLTYLHNYINHFGFRDCIQLCTTVEAVVPRAFGKWEINTRSGNITKTEMFDAVLICGGCNRYPLTPSYPGVEIYQGTTLHSSHYKGPEGYNGKDILVVGVGISGAEIAFELSQVAHQVLLSTANGAWFIPRYIGTRPYDHYLRRLSGVPYKLKMYFLHHLLLQEYKRMGIEKPLDFWGMPVPVFDARKARFTPTAELLPMIVNGSIAVKPLVSRLEEKLVVFSDGTKSRVDTIISSTGYTLRFPFLDESLIKVEDNRIDLYKHVFHPDVPNLAFIGLCSIAGPFLPVAEIQARWVARVLSGAINLPSSKQMHREISQRRDDPKNLSPYPMHVQWLEYMDEINKIMGRRPNSFHHRSRFGESQHTDFVYEEKLLMR